MVFSIVGSMHLLKCFDLPIDNSIVYVPHLLRFTEWLIISNRIGGQRLHGVVIIEPGILSVEFSFPKRFVTLL
jgi:hypothetical protein